MKSFPSRAGFGLLALLAACQSSTTQNGLRIGDSNDPPQIAATDGRCWTTDTSPAIIETVTEQAVLQPARKDSAGNIVSPARYQTVTRQEIVRPRRQVRFETPCPAQMTPAFIATLQRALKVRGYYRGNVTAKLDDKTRSAIKRYQSVNGLESANLSIGSARALGIINAEPVAGKN